MPYIIVRTFVPNEDPRGTTDSKVQVSGLTGKDIVELSKINKIAGVDLRTVVFSEHISTVLTALEVLGYKVVTCAGGAADSHGSQFLWTMRREFSEPEPDILE